MRKLLLLAVGVTFYSVVHAQTSTNNIAYQLCDQDFSPIYMHKNLPANAVYTNTKATPEARANDVIKRLTFDEKLMLTGGWKSMHYPSIPKLGIPPVYFADASQGIHLKALCIKPEKSTSFPSTQALAATWDNQLAYNYARALSEECQAWGVNVLLGPGLNMYRNSEGGRNYEYLGEDPYLTSRIGVNYVKGMQSLGTIATIKHFIGNEQEFARHIVDERISERALHEIYLPPFKAAILEAHAGAVMTSNNMVNGMPGAANKPLSNDVLRAKYGFKGVIMSDWAQSTFWPDRLALEIPSGHSLLMDNNELFAKYVQQEIAAHPERKAEIEAGLNRMVFYNLYTFFKSGVYDRPYRNPALVGKIESHKEVARKTGEEAITLLKNNDNILPLKPGKQQKVIVMGTDEALSVYTGKGSGNVDGYDHVGYVAGLQKLYGDNLTHKASYTDDEIKKADVVIYFIEKPAGEGFDIAYDIPEMAAKIESAAALNKNIVVVYSGGNGFPMPWLPQVKGLVFAYLLGQERGNALANVISGNVNPSGKLPFSIEKDFNDSPAKDYNKMPDGKYYWMGGKPHSKQAFEKFGTVPINYSEGIYIGYRWFEKHKIQPQFPFGFGLSYTHFNYSNIKVSSSTLSKGKFITVTFTLKNTGPVDGTEIAQLYVHDMNAAANKPVKELKAYQRVWLKAGEAKTISMPVKADDLAYWSEKTHNWQIDNGNYMLEIGASSADIKQQIKISYK